MKINYTENIKPFFSGLFANLILKNKIVATVLSAIKGEMYIFKKEMDYQLNDDI
jgi:hypothetical protein